MVNYLKAFKRPFSGDKYIFLKAAIPIYNWAIFGYVLECIRNTLNGKDELPNWEKSSWLDKIINPLVAGLFTIIYFGAVFIIPGILIFIKRDLINSFVPYSAYILLGVLAFFLSYYCLAGYVAFIRTLKMDDVNYNKVNRIIYTGKYFLAWFIAIVLLSVESWLTIFFGKIPYLSLLNIVALYVFHLIALTIVAESIREIEKEKRL